MQRFEITGPSSDISAAVWVCIATPYKKKTQPDSVIDSNTGFIVANAHTTVSLSVTDSCPRSLSYVTDKAFLPPVTFPRFSMIPRDRGRLSAMVRLQTNPLLGHYLTEVVAQFGSLRSKLLYVAARCSFVVCFGEGVAFLQGCARL